jgi:cytoskeletal protein CcmA (bactofilin family)
MLFRRRGTIIAEGLKIVGSVTAEGLVEVNGRIEGDLFCTSLIVSPQASINGGIQAERVVVNGRVEGPIHGGEVVLKSRAYVIGDIEHDSLTIDAGAYFDGRSVRTLQLIEHAPPEKITARSRKDAAHNVREAAAAA